MDHDEHFSGRWGTGRPNYDNDSWRRGNEERLNEQHRQQQEAQRAAERQRLDESMKAWSEAMAPKPAPSISWPSSSSSSSSSGAPQHYAGSSAPARVAPTYASGGGSYSEPSLWEQFVDSIFAPFRWAWALIKFAFKAALVLLVLAVVAFILVNESKRESASSPVAPAERPTLPSQARLDEAPRVVAPSLGAPAVQAPSAEAPAVEVAADEPSNVEVPSAPAAPAPRYPRLGATIRDLSTNELQRLASESIEGGAVVVTVLPDSPAADTRLQPDDVIVSLNFKGVGSGQGLIDLVREQAVGVSVPIVFYRDGIKYAKNIVPALAE